MVLMMEAGFASEISVKIYQATWRNIPANSQLRLKNVTQGSTNFCTECGLAPSLMLQVYPENNLLQETWVIINLLETE
jgi:hypothetical protein